MDLTLVFRCTAVVAALLDAQCINEIYEFNSFSKR